MTVGVFATVHLDTTFSNHAMVTRQRYDAAMTPLPGDGEPARCSELKHSFVSPQRRFPRFQFHESVSIGILDGEVPTYVHGRGVDLAEGGAGVTTGSKLQIGDTVHLQIPLAAGAIRLPARVRYQYGSEYGFEFVALGVPEREYIREACRSLMRIG
jgi:hypothetical protein